MLSKPSKLNKLRRPEKFMAHMSWAEGVRVVTSVATLNDCLRLTVLGGVTPELIDRLDHLQLRAGEPIALRGGHWAIPLKAADASLAQQLRTWYPATDMAIQQPQVLPQVAVFDMDSTLIGIECIDELAAAHGVGEQVAAVTERAMQGELDFSASFEQRLSQLRGLSRSAVNHLADHLPLNPGLEKMVAGLKQLGCRLVIASGGFTAIADHLAAQHGFDRVVANQLAWQSDDTLSGGYHGSIVDGARKATVLKEELEHLGIDAAASLAMGDGANDLAMISEAGIGIAYHAKPVVVDQAPLAIRHHGLDACLAYLGLKA